MTVTTTARRDGGSALAGAALDLREPAERAGEAFMAALRAAIDRLPEPPQLDEPTQLRREALGTLRPGSAEPVLAAADAALQAFALVGRRDFTPAPEIGRSNARTRLPAVMAALDAALTRFDRQDELDAAEQRVAELERRQRDALRSLERAVSEADVDQVMALRPAVEIQLPTQVERAGVAVAELRLARAEALQDLPRRRATAAATAEEEARAALEEARAAVEARVAELQAASQEMFTAKQAQGQAESQVQQLQAERDRLAEESARSAQERMRRLAGLPPEDPAPAVGRWEPPAPVSMMSTYVLGRSTVGPSADEQRQEELARAEAKAAFERAKEVAQSPIVTFTSPAAKAAEAQANQALRGAAADAEWRAAEAARRGRPA